MKDEWERFFASGRIDDYLKAKQVEQGSDFRGKKEQWTGKYDPLSKTVNDRPGNNLRITF